MSGVPFAPLTHEELNSRVDSVASRVAWRVAACLRDGGEFRDDDMATLRQCAEELDSWHAAAMARVEVAA